MTSYTLDQLLQAPCPHGVKLGKCQDDWCRNRTEDLLANKHLYDLPELGPKGG